MSRPTPPDTATEWADRIEALMDGYDWDIYSLAFTAGNIAEVDIDLDADDHEGSWFASADQRWTVRYDRVSDHWYPV